MEDKWLPGEPCLRPLVTKKHLSFKWVSELIDQKTRKWRTDRICEFFLEETARNIQKLPLSQSDIPDSIFWSLSKDGKYSVKSGYYCAFSSNVDTTNEASSSAPDSAFWKRLWSLNIQPKVKHCVWGAAVETLPCLEALRKKHILNESVCVFCNAGEDSLIHIFKQCKFSSLIWKELGLKVHKDLGENCIAWFREVFSRCSLKECELFCCTIWILWWEHNRRSHGEDGKDISRLTEFIRSLERTEVGDDPHSVIEGKRSETKWKPPKAERYKLNVDAAVPSADGNCSAGFIVRNTNGEVMLSGATPIGPCISALHAELTSILVGLRYAQEGGFRELEVASDCQNAVYACIGVANMANYMRSLVDDIRKLSGSLKFVSFEYESRKANVVAHELTKWGLSLTESVILVEDVPSFIFPCIVSDAM